MMTERLDDDRLVVLVDALVDDALDQPRDGQVHETTSEVSRTSARVASFQ